MAALFRCGFDFFSTQAQMDLVMNAARTGTWTVNASGGRRGGGCASISNAQGHIGRILPSTYSTLIAGMAYQQTSVATVTNELMLFGDGALVSPSVQVSIAIDSNMALRAYRGTAGGTLLGTSANNAVVAGSMQYVEAKVLVSATVGTVEVRVNGIAVLTLTGLNTKNTSNTTMTQVGLGSIQNGGNLFDDFYINDTSGSVNNDFIGDRRIDTLYPNADGNYQQYTPSTGTAHFSLVNAHAPQIATFVSDSVIGDRDSYGLDNLTAITGTISDVQLSIYANKSDAGARSLKALIRSNVTNSLDAAVALATGANYRPVFILENDPNTGVAWTESGVNAMEVGQEVA